MESDRVDGCTDGWMVKKFKQRKKSVCKSHAVCAEESDHVRPRFETDRQSHRESDRKVHRQRQKVTNEGTDSDT